MGTSAFDQDIRILYNNLLLSWNHRNAREMASFFSEDGYLIGFDGSTINGRHDIESHLSDIFRDHQTASFVSKVRNVRFLSPDIAVLLGIAGMLAPGASALNPDTNAIQTLITSRHEGNWIIEVFQNTPAAFHGHPELRQQLTDELSGLVS